MKGYYDFNTKYGLITDAYVYETMKDGMTLECECCGRKLNKWLSVNYIDECENEVEAIYGITCFKKISHKSNTVEI